MAFAQQDAEERRAVAELFTREITPVGGTLEIGGQKLNELHQRVIATRIGYADPSPYVFQGTFGDNVLMPLKQRPLSDLPDPMGEVEEKRRAYESKRTGNSLDRLFSEWINPNLGDLENEDAVHAWWVSLMDATGAGQRAVPQRT